MELSVSRRKGTERAGAGGWGKAGLSRVAAFPMFPEITTVLELGGNIILDRGILCQPVRHTRETAQTA
ncbi:hypothetical protein SAMN05216299_12114 [Nitrosospira sp. Nsp14]|nr:hypothetical protein SAMN05216299_12114 [Nitrosospira sp. Nsp14]